MPEGLRVSDPLSDVLSTLKLRGGIFVKTEASAPWSIAFPPGDAHFHIVERGEVAATAPGLKKPVHAVAGDLIMFPHGAGHTIADRVTRRPVALDKVVKQGWDPGAGVLRVGQGERNTRMICGTFDLERTGGDALLSVLPPILRVEGRSGEPTHHVALVLQLFLSEAHSTSPGSALCAARLVDLLLIQAIRHWLSQQPASAQGWLGAMRDPHVGAALSKLHAMPAHPWTVDELAKQVGLSRSPFAARFTALIREPPMRYLTRWRMHVAAQLLMRGNNVGEAAEQVGYQSEAAFSRAFKKYIGRPPVKLRGAQG